MNHRSELKRAHKERPIQAGIFQIRHRPSGRILLGSSRNLEGVWNGIRFRLEMGNYLNAGLQQAWQQDGPSAFVYEELDRLPPDAPRSDLEVLETLWFEQLKPVGDKGFNTKGIVRTA